MRYRSNGDWACPLVIRAPCGGGIHGALYHSQSIEAFYAHVPGLKVVLPSTPADAAGLLRAAIRDPDPVLFLEHKTLLPADQGRGARGRPHRADRHRRRRATGHRSDRDHLRLRAAPCLEAAERLAEDEGVSVEVVDVRTLAPLDVDTILASVRKTARAMVVYEDNRTYGAGAEIAATIAEEAMFDLDAPVVRIGGPDIPAMPYAAALEHFYTEPRPTTSTARCRTSRASERTATHPGHRYSRPAPVRYQQPEWGNQRAPVGQRAARAAATCSSSRRPLPCCSSSGGSRGRSTGSNR